MIYRKATISDTQNIVSLIELTLGNNSTKKSIEFWKWKHIDNVLVNLL